MRLALLEKSVNPNIYVEQLGELLGMKVWYVDGTVVRETLDIDYIGGGNPSRYGYIPDDEIWIESLTNAEDTMSYIIHELTEWHMMDAKGMTYEEAHAVASESEEKFREWPDRKEYDDVIAGVETWLRKVGEPDVKKLKRYASHADERDKDVQPSGRGWYP